MGKNTEEEYINGLMGHHMMDNSKIMYSTEKAHTYGLIIRSMKGFEEIIKWTVWELYSGLMVDIMMANLEKGKGMVMGGKYLWTEGNIVVIGRMADRKV